MPRRRDLGDIDGRQHRRAADREPAYETEDEKRRPAGRERAAEPCDEIEDSEHAQAVAAAEGVAGLACKQGADQCSPERGGHGDAERFGGEGEEAGEVAGHARDDRRIESEEEPGERRRPDRSGQDASARAGLRVSAGKGCALGRISHFSLPQDRRQRRPLSLGHATNILSIK